MKRGSGDGGLVERVVSTYITCMLLSIMAPIFIPGISGLKQWWRRIQRWYSKISQRQLQNTNPEFTDQSWNNTVVVSRCYCFGWQYCITLNNSPTGAYMQLQLLGSNCCQVSNGLYKLFLYANPDALNDVGINGGKALRKSMDSQGARVGC